MKTKIKRYICKSIVLILALLTVSLHTPEAAIQSSSNTADPSVYYEMVKPNLYKAYAPNTKDIKAYTRYINKYLSSKKKYPGRRAVVCDINGDGIYEMFFSYNSGVRSTYKIYTYKKRKIIKMEELSGVNEIVYSRSRKQICVIASNSSSHSILTCYKMVSNKLKQASEYESISNYSGGSNKVKYYKNNKRISAKRYNKFSKRIFKWPTI